MKNIAEILKNCPTGMELDCTMFDNVTFVRVNTQGEFPIEIKVDCNTMYLTKEGCYHRLDYRPSAKCVIFPKGKTTWEGFQSFKEGDVLYIDCNDDEDTYEEHQYIFILKNISEDKIDSYCYVNGTNESKFEICWLATMTDIKYSPRFATEEEKEKLFKAIKDNGYRWNAETKTLDKLIVPKFKIGDRIKSKIDQVTYTITDIRRDVYIVYIDMDKFGYHIPFSMEKNYELIPNKFDITTLKPFDKVLVRYGSLGAWNTGIFSHTVKSDNKLCFIVNTQYWEQCIPYEGNEHLRGTTDSCSDYFKTWE